jgi:hypothetical protein
MTIYVCHSTKENLCYYHCLTYDVSRQNGLHMYILSLVIDLLYVQVTVRRDNLRINNQKDASSIQVRSNLTLLGRGHITCMKHTICHVYS